MLAGTTHYGITKAHLVLGTWRNTNDGYKRRKEAVTTNINGAE
jgi:hypothetical protein